MSPNPSSFFGRFFKKAKRIEIQSPRGTYDILPEDRKFWDLVEDTAKKQAEINGYERIETPIFEQATLFEKGVGATTDIVEKQMFRIENPEGEPYALRPEYTAGIVRSYIEHGMQTLPQPVQLYAIGPCFRRERPQAGRFRQFWQVDFELIGAADPISDSRMISLGWNILKDLGLKDLTVKINSLGCKRCKKDLRQFLLSFYSKKRMLLCGDCLRRLEENPFRLLDCKEEKCQKIADQIPQLIDQLCENCREDFKTVLESLDAGGITYDLDPKLVRGLDYYTKTTFEFVLKKDLTKKLALGGGGRYDDLIELYGGRPTPAVGMALGIDRIIEVLKEQKVKVLEKEKTQVFIVQLGEMAKKKVVKILDELTKEGISARAALSKDSIKSQLKLANKLTAKIALIIGQREALDNTIIVRDMKTGIQEVVKQTKYLEKVKEKLAKNE